MKLKLGLSKSGGSPYIVDSATGHMVKGVRSITFDYSKSLRVQIELEPTSQPYTRYDKWVSVEPQKTKYEFVVLEFPELEFTVPSVLAEKLETSDDLQLYDGNLLTQVSIQHNKAQKLALGLVGATNT